jgi:hypothetical protein
MRRALLHFACAFLLVSAQLSALTHSIWHLHDYLPAQVHHDHAGAVHDHGGDEGPSSQAELCAFHAALGSLFEGGCATQTTLAPADLPLWLASAPAAWHFPQTALTPPTRAPPVLL